MAKKADFGIDNWLHFIGGAVANAVKEGSDILVFHWPADEINPNGWISITIKNTSANDERFPQDFLDLVDSGS